MTDLRAAAQQALEAIDRALPHAPPHSAFDVLADCADDLRAALSTCKEDLQVEPFAWLWQHRETGRFRVVMPNERTATDVAAAWDVIGPLYLGPPHALRAALAEPVQAPYAWMAVGGSIWRHKTSEDDVPLYTVPPKRKPLTDDQITAINASLKIGTTTELVRAVERAHGIGGDA